MERVTVVGAGTWGTTIAALVADRAHTTLWARRPGLAEAIDSRMENPDYLEGFRLPSGLRCTSDLEIALAGSEAVVMAVPSHGYRVVIEKAASWIPDAIPILSLTKGIEQETLLRMTEVTHEIIPDHPPERIGVMTGPNLAREIISGQPAATVVAMLDQRTASALQELFMSPTLRVYTNPDVIGCESAGALKNTMAIAAGMAHGLGFGENTLATLITRALAEITRLGVAMGGDPFTFAGLAGMGDLIATCMSPKSRNHQVGYGLAEGKSIDQIVTEMNMVAEGVKSTEAVTALANRHEVEMPIAEQVGRVLYENVTVGEAIISLMGRTARSEVERHHQ